MRCGSALRVLGAALGLGQAALKLAEMLQGVTTVRVVAGLSLRGLGLGSYDRFIRIRLASRLRYCLHLRLRGDDERDL